MKVLLSLVSFIALPAFATHVRGVGQVYMAQEHAQGCVWGDNVFAKSAKSQAKQAAKEECRKLGHSSGKVIDTAYDLQNAQAGYYYCVAYVTMKCHD